MKPSSVAKQPNLETPLNSELGKACAREVADMFRPIMFKASTLVAAPIQLKCGMLVELFSCKCSRSTTASYRDVVLNDLGVKAYAKYIRSSAKLAFHEDSVRLQYGSAIGG